MEALEDNGYSASAAKSKANAYIGSVESGKHPAFIKGGLARFTGLAQLDGTPLNPERVLSPVQTKLFEALVQSLQTMARVRVNPMASIRTNDYAGNGGNNSFGDINIHVDSLDKDTDFDELAERVKESIVDSMGFGKPVGGIRFR